MNLKKINGIYSLPNALKLIRASSGKINEHESVELVMNLNLLSGKKKYTYSSDMLLPHDSFKKPVKIAVFIENDGVEWALREGADYAGNESLVDLIKKSSKNLPFDVCIGTPSTIKYINSVKTELMKKNMYPTLRNGLIAQNLENVLKNLKRGVHKLKNDKFNNLHLKVGTLSLTDKELINNIMYVFDEVILNKPKQIKLSYILRSYITTTHGRSVAISL